MAPFVVAVFLSAFLLFQVQPIIARVILPVYGGSPGVWTSCMMFFQLALLLGYFYAHLMATRLTVRSQVILHLTLLTIVLILLPKLQWLELQVGHRQHSLEQQLIKGY